MEIVSVMIGKNSARDGYPNVTLKRLGISYAELYDIVGFDVYANGVKLFRALGQTQGNATDGANQIYLNGRWEARKVETPIHRAFTGKDRTELKPVDVDVDSVLINDPKDVADYPRSKKKRPESAGVPKRRDVSAETRMRHIECVRIYFNGNCPCCQSVAVLMKIGSQIVRSDEAEIDHWSDNRNNNRADQTWLVCRVCNARFNRDPNSRIAVRPIFEVYQMRLAKVDTNGKVLR